LRGGGGRKEKNNDGEQQKERDMKEQRKKGFWSWRRETNNKNKVEMGNLEKKDARKEIIKCGKKIV